MKDTFAYFELKLQSKFSAEQVIYALDKYTDTHNDIPSPADIINMLNPAKHLITEAQFVEAQKWQERNGYPVFSDALTTIETYHKQNNDKRDEFKIENENIAALVSGSANKMID